MLLKSYTIYYLFTLLLIFFCLPFAIQAQEVLGVHILHPAEISDAAKLIKNEFNTDSWSYVTLPLSLNDLDKHHEWQTAFNYAKEKKINPLIRFVTRFDPDKNAWAIPTRGEIMSYFTFLNQLDWPDEKRYLIIFNEPNHFSEWGGVSDPASYAEILSFTADWAHTENENYRVLPAAMDLAAPNGSTTTEAFTYLNAMFAAQPDVFTKIDYWNSHSYPNPAFSAPANRTGQNSLRGFTYELAWLAEKTNLTPKVFITETGWTENTRTKRHLFNYYAYANEHIWSDERIMAVTPFILKGDPGPFTHFSLIDQHGQPKLQYDALAEIIKKNSQANQIEISDF